VVGIDPGKRIGLGVASGSGLEPSYTWGQVFEDPMEVWREVVKVHSDFQYRPLKLGPKAFFVAVENYVGSGRRNTDQTLTDRRIGWFDHACHWFEYDHALVMPDARRWKLRASGEALGKKVSFAPGAHDDDDVSALAHALSRYDKIWRTL
jgi:hypothetical protein